jgi:hypothetical protein
MWPTSRSAIAGGRSFQRMYVYETVTVLVTVGTLVIGTIDYFRSGGVLSQLGRHGNMWLDHAADAPLADRPSEDEMDAPIPRRPLRGRI